MAKYDRNIDVKGFSDAVNNTLDLYVKDVQAQIPDIVKRAGEHCVQAIRMFAVLSGLPDKKYAKSWKSKITAQNAWGTFVTVYSPKYYRIAHLLEFGHDVKNAHGKIIGTAKAYTHLKDAEENSILFLENTMKKELGK